MNDEFEWVAGGIVAVDESGRRKTERERLNTVTEESARCDSVYYVVVSGDDKFC